MLSVHSVTTNRTRDNLSWYIGVDFDCSDAYYIINRRIILNGIKIVPKILGRQINRRCLYYNNSMNNENVLAVRALKINIIIIYIKRMDNF